MPPPSGARLRRARRERRPGEQRLLEQAKQYPSAFRGASTALLSVAPHLLGGDTYAAAQAGLARVLERLAAGEPLVLNQIEPLPPRPAGAGITALGLRVQGESDLEGVLTLLAALEAGPLLLQVENVAIEAANGLAGEAMDSLGTPETLAFDFALVGYVFADPDSAGAGGAPTVSAAPGVQ